MRYGYAWSSIEDQNLNMQIDALKKAGCEIIFKEKVTAEIKERPELNKLVKKLKKGDSVVVWKIDRFGGNVRNLVDLLNDFNSKGVSFSSLEDNISTAKPESRLKSSRARGKNGGRPPGLTDESYKTALAAYQLYQNKELSIADILKKTRISQGTLYKYVSHIRKEKEANQQEV
ncbi:MAG: recombinase family protein [Chitinophagaceae bacterium]|nr:recombinase family protein [Chitinophagaceae bacterium]